MTQRSVQLLQTRLAFIGLMSAFLNEEKSTLTICLESIASLSHTAYDHAIMFAVSLVRIFDVLNCSIYTVVVLHICRDQQIRVLSESQLGQDEIFH
jgi:hypothetical protein